MNPQDLVPAVSGLAFLPHLRDLGIAYILAFVIGWNREREDRSAGLRTFPLVAVAACGFIQATEGVIRSEPEALARIAEGIITGIGFIGGGAILKMRNSVRGTATAASLWATGAIGTAVGLGAWAVALLLTVLTVMTLRLLTPLKVEATTKAPEDHETGPPGVER